MAITFHHVSYQYGAGTPWAHQALQDISFHVAPGECVGIVGHTGSGKSTLLQIASGLIKPDSGSLDLAGLLLDAKKSYPTKEIISRVGMVFQYPESQLFGETVAEDIAYGAKNRGLSPEIVRERVRQAMACVGLDESYLPRSPYLLSGGEKRRVAIAGILAMAPQVLILDEPTAGLDAKGRLEFQTMLANWQQQENSSILWVSHDMAELAQITDRVLVLHQGHLIWDGSLRQALQKPEIWQRAGLALPPSAQLVQRLAALGCPLDATAITPEQAVESLNNWARGQKT